MSYRFVPWVRRGLASAVTTPDPLTTDMPIRANFNVSVRVSTGDPGGVTLQLYGPGDVIGVDPRAIVRAEPKRFARDFPPDHFAAIEFDPPDFPWMFSPAAAGAGDRLRPWLVLVVVEQRDGVSIKVARDRPLPQLVIEAPAVPANELPDLSESWAWAHAHVVEDATPASVPAYVRDNPNLNVSRLLCPRRLAPDRDYYACLVPAFEAGRQAGLGQDVPDTTTTAPAWGGGNGVGASVTIPLYFHWEFRTGPAGDFEALARRLTPRPIPDTVGHRRMYIGAASPALPALPPDAGGIVEMEGALRAPDAGTGDDLPAETTPWADALVPILNAPAADVVHGASPDAESVAPPIYGGNAVKKNELDDIAPKWLAELNEDPRHRTAAGLGAEIVRINQERFMQAAWEQVGDVLAANEKLDRARFLQQVAQRIHTRHVAALGAEALLAITAPIHQRVVVDNRVLDRVVATSVLPAGVTDASFRRLASPRAPALTRAARRAGNEAVAVTPRVVAELASGSRTFDPLAQVPDGLVSSRLLDRFPASPSGEVTPEIGNVVAIPATTVTGVRTAVTQLHGQTIPSSPVLRPDLAISGIVLSRQLEQVREVPGISVGHAIRSIVASSLVTPAATNFTVARAGGRGLAGVHLQPIEVGPRQPIDPGTVVVERPVTDRVTINKFTEAFTAQSNALAVTVTSIVPPPATIDLAAMRDVLVAATEPSAVIETRARLGVQVAGRSLHDGLLAIGPIVQQLEPLDPVMVGPLIPEALYADLAAADPDRFLPGVGDIPDDTVTMLETNPRFVEAFLIGANHEMGRELLWRRYPTDRRGTPFHRFWDRVNGAEDIGPINEFKFGNALGTNGHDDLRGSLVLLVRGALLRRYPNSVVYAVPALADQSLDPDPAKVHNPVFWGRLDPDVTFVGFSLTREDVEPAPGYYFVIAEQVMEPTFAFDTPVGNAGAPASWSDVDWSHVAVAPNSYVRLATSPLAGRDLPIIENKPARATFGRNAADMAAISFQRPFRAAIHSSKVIAGVDPPGGGQPIRPILARATLLRPILDGRG